MIFNTTWIIFFLFIVFLVGVFLWWWKKRLDFSKKNLIEHTHGPGIRLQWFLRLFNLIAMIYQKITGSYILVYNPKKFMPESHFEDERKVFNALGPRHSFSEEEWRQAQKDGINLLCEAINGPDFPWTAFGRTAQFVTQLREFQTRQKITKYALENIDILKSPIDDDNGLLIVTGLPRTGSTFLQALLSLDPNAKTPRTWEMWRTVPPAEGLDVSKHPNVILMEKDVKTVDFACPNYMQTLRRVHYFDATSPEEDVIFLYHAPWRWNFLLFLWNTRLADWWLNSPISSAFACRYLHLCFKVMTSKLKPKHVITKNPGHSYYLEALLREFPKANIVITHRHPSNVVPSWSKICLFSWHLFFQNEFRSPDRYEDLTVKGHTKSILKQLSILAQRIVDSRKRISETDPEKAQKQFFDVNFGNLIHKPAEVIKQIYDHFGYEFSDEFNDRINDYIDNQPRLKYKRVDYNLEELNLTEQDIDNEFADYIKTYKDYF